MSAAAGMKESARSTQGELPGRHAAGPGPAVHVLTESARREAYLSSLLYIEQRARDAATKQELAFLIVNDSRKISGSRQIFLVSLEAGKPKVIAISDVTAVDPAAPFVQWAEQLAQRLADDGGLADARIIALRHSGTKTIVMPNSTLFRISSGRRSRAATARFLPAAFFARQEPWNETEKAPNPASGRNLPARLACSFREETLQGQRPPAALC